jgi:galactonate dehydratase
MSKRLIKELEPLYPYFVEEPCLPGNTAALVELKNSTTVPLATGERIFTKWGFRDLIEQRAVDILQPDLCHAGGIMEVKKISAMAEASDLAVAPHNPLGPISLAACLQLDACTLNAVAQEQVTLGDGYLVKPFEMENGYIELPTEPGLGIELDEEKVRALEYDGNWETPRVIDQRDGSVAEW